MDILKIAIDWAKAELVSTSFFILCGIIFLSLSFGLWQFGKTDLAKGYIVPMLVAGLFLMTVGIGLFSTNKSRIVEFEVDYNDEPISFINSELERVDRTLNEYKTIVFTSIPVIILVCSIVIFLVDRPLWRASMITTILMLGVILLIDGLAHARISDYKSELDKAMIEMKK